MSIRVTSQSVRASSTWAIGVILVVATSAFAADAPSPAAVQTQAVAQPPEVVQALDAYVISLLQRTAKALESRSIEPHEEADFRALVAAAELLKADRKLLATERVRLEGLVRIRLRHASETLTRQEQRDAKSKSAAARLPDVPVTTTLAQQLPGLGAGAQGVGPGFAGGIGTQQAGGTDQQAEKLIDLIQAIIAPSTWDVNGGQGVIRYWSLGHGLVIRNTSAEHEKVGDVLQQLR